MSGVIRIVCAVVLATIADAGLVASTTTDLKDFTLISVNDIWLLPGLALIGALLVFAIDDVARSAIALVVVAVLGSGLFAFAIASPGLQIKGVRVTLIDRATNFGLLAFMLILFFGLGGMVVAWLIDGWVVRSE
jgi:hypothetical protein